MSVEQWSRPRLQRQELGPMIHDLGHTILDLAEARVLEDSIGPRPNSPDKLAGFGWACVKLIRTVQEEVVDPSAVFLGEHAIVETFIKLNRDRHKVTVNGDTVDQRITYYSSLNRVMSEGLASGVISPLQLYRTAKVIERDRRPRFLQGEPKIRAREAAKRIMTDEFQTMLHQLATNPNTTLGVVSTSPDYLKSDGVGNSFGTIEVYGLEQSFERNKKGRVIGFTPEYLEFQKEYKKKLGQIGLSGGCPVRHTTFPVLGEHAQAYFEALKRPDGQPQNQGESLITRASRFVSTALRVSARGGQS